MLPNLRGATPHTCEPTGPSSQTCVYIYRYIVSCRDGRGGIDIHAIFAVPHGGIESRVSRLDEVWVVYLSICNRFSLKSRNCIYTHIYIYCSHDAATRSKRAPPHQTWTFLVDMTWHNTPRPAQSAQVAGPLSVFFVSRVINFYYFEIDVFVTIWGHLDTPRCPPQQKQIPRMIWCLLSLVWYTTHEMFQNMLLCVAGTTFDGSVPSHWRGEVMCMPYYSTSCIHAIICQTVQHIAFRVLGVPDCVLRSSWVAFLSICILCALHASPLSQTRLRSA